MGFAALKDDCKKACTLFQRAFEIRKSTDTLSTHEGANLLKGLAEAQRATEQLVEARASLEEALRIREDIGNLESPDGPMLGCRKSCDVWCDCDFYTMFAICDGDWGEAHDCHTHMKFANVYKPSTAIIW